MRERSQSAIEELDQILSDLREHPINYNYYYTETVDNCRGDRDFRSFAACIEASTTYNLLPGCNSTHTSASLDLKHLRQVFGQNQNPDMDVHSCEVALDGLIAIYKVSERP